MRKVSWKAGTQFPVAANVADDTIRKLQQRLGKDTITARELLDNSRPQDAPLHSCFEWDNAIAAESYRIYQARKIIGSIEIVVITSDDKPTKVRAFHNVQIVAPKKEGQFVSFDIAFSNKDYRRDILRNAWFELRAFQQKYQSYSELARVFDAINDFGDSVT